MDLSVLIINYNHGTFLENRITSILSQLPKNSELVILDDASTDSSVEIANRLAAEDQRVRVYVNPRNLGVCANINQSPRVARGAYIMPLAADDDLMPGALEKLLRPLLNHPEMGIATSRYATFDESTAKKWVQPLPDFLMQAPYSVLPKEKMPSIIKRHSLACGSCLMLKKELWFKFGGYQKRLGTDWFFNSALALSEGLIFIPEVLQYWVNRPASYGNSFANTKKSRLFYTLDYISNYPTLRKLFLRSEYLYPLCKEFFLDLLRHPKYYDFILQTIYKKVFKRS